MTAQLVATLLDVCERDIVPLTAKGVASGSKLFGAAILTKDKLDTVQLATNDESQSPLLHGEINCIQKYWAKTGDKPATKDCVFFATHEPCSLCLSGITWSGFDNFYYLFTYEDSRDLFSIPYDIDILEQVFRVKAPSDTDETVAARPLYNKTNKFFTARSLAELVDSLPDDTADGGPAEMSKAKLHERIRHVKKLYDDLSKTYQDGKSSGAATSSVFK